MMYNICNELLKYHLFIFVKIEECGLSFFFSFFFIFFLILFSFQFIFHFSIFRTLGVRVRSDQSTLSHQSHLMV